MRDIPWQSRQSQMDSDFVQVQCIPDDYENILVKNASNSKHDGLYRVAQDFKTSSLNPIYVKVGESKDYLTKNADLQWKFSDSNLTEGFMVQKLPNCLSLNVYGIDKNQSGYLRFTLIQETNTKSEGISEKGPKYQSMDSEGMYLQQNTGIFLSILTCYYLS